MSTHASDTTTVGEALGAVRERWRRRSVLRAALRGGAGLVLLWGAGLGAVWLGHFGSTAVAALFGGLLVASAAWIAVIVRRRDRPPADRALARHIEEQHPGFEDRLVTAVDVSARATPGPLDALLLADAVRALEREPLDDVVPGESVRAAGRRAAAVGAVLVAVLAAWTVPAWHALGVARAFLVPSTVTIDVRPGDVRIAPGRALEISATTGVAGLVPELTIAAGDRSRRLPMAARGDRYVARFDSVPGSFEYRVSAGNARSTEYRVTLLEPPKLEGIDLRYEFPAYTRLAPREERDGGDIYAPSGTTVRVTVRASAATVAGDLVLGGTRVPLQAGAGPLTTTLAVKADGSYRVALRSRDGLESAGDTEYFIRVLDDRPPDVRIVRPATDRQVTPLEEVTIEARADDDYGIERFDLVYSVRGGAERVVPFSGERTPLTATGRHTIYLEDLEVAPGDFVTYYARARDIGRGKRSTEARSDIYFLEVTPFNQEFAAAQSQAQMQGGGRSMDDLVSAQKDVIVATWKLDRRRGAGRSTEDLKTVARAQADVRQRTERAAAMMRGPRRRPTQGSGPDPDPLGAAAAAMAKAQAALEASNSASAVAPEMEALNHLLRAQAENRRREVARQQAGMGGGGGNRAQQDLSSLFDRELKRQQQTNYETPRTAQEREQNGEDDLLERLRALAARQEQLARQQEDLAKGGADLEAEERRRRLERLTREQSELRRQAEQLAQQMQSGRQQQGQPQPGQSQRSGGASASDLREASDDMQAAAGELRRDDAKQASARSAKAAERLRDLERQMQGRAPDERRRALGDLQLEARQLADRQRRLGEEAAEGRTQPDASDRSRRLAGEQERLADRADRLGQQLDALRKSATGKGASAIEGARKELESGRVGESMREAARELRGGAPSGAERAEAAGKSAARALDRLADRLSDATGQRDAAERKLSDQLSRAREVREKMGELERQIAELQRRGQSPGASGRDGKPATQGTSPSSSPGGQAQGGARPGTSGDQAERQGREQMERLQREYAEQVREAARLQQELSGRQGRERGGAGAGSTPEGQLMVMSAPGTEAFKQDFSKWEVLHKDVTLGLEQLEASLSQQLLEKALRERLATGAADSAPGPYKDAVDRYFRSLAGPKE